MLMNTGDSTVLKRFGVWDDLRRTICTLAELVNLKKRKKVRQVSMDVHCTEAQSKAQKENKEKKKKNYRLFGGRFFFKCSYWEQRSRNLRWRSWNDGPEAVGVWVTRVCFISTNTRKDTSKFSFIWFLVDTLMWLK